MDEVADAQIPAASQDGTDAALRRVCEAARSFIAYRERMAMMEAGQIPAPRNLAEAIDRDFLAFDVERALRELREAVLDMNPMLASNLEHSVRELREAVLAVTPKRAAAALRPVASPAPAAPAAPKLPRVTTPAARRRAAAHRAAPPPPAPAAD